MIFFLAAAALLYENRAPLLAEYKAADLERAEKRKAANPAQQQHEYDVARRSMLGEFSASPISACQECIANAKAARRRERLELTSRALVACPDNAEAAIRLRRDMDEVENMRCAKHVYLANDPNAPAELRDNPPPGFLKPSPEQLAEMGLNEKMLKPDGSEFRAAVYIKDPAVWGENAKPASVLAYRGSTSSPEDWQNNFAQDANKESVYYRNAVKIGNTLAGKGADVHIVGHSLGGGMASATQGASGLTASTYNAAGLNRATVARYSKDAEHMAAEPEKITATRIRGEVLTKTQEGGLTGLFASDAAGTRRDLDPATSEAEFNRLKAEGKVDSKEDYATYLHGIDEVIAATEKQKQADENTLNSCINKEEP